MGARPGSHQRPRKGPPQSSSGPRQGKWIRVDHVGNSEELTHRKLLETMNMQARGFCVRPFACHHSLAIRRCAGIPKDTPDNFVASCVLYHLCMLRCIKASLRAPPRSPSKDDCSLQTAASFSTRNAGAAGIAG